MEARRVDGLVAPGLVARVRDSLGVPGSKHRSNVRHVGLRRIEAVACEQPLCIAHRSRKHLHEWFSHLFLSCGRVQGPHMLFVVRRVILGFNSKTCTLRMLMTLARQLECLAGCSQSRRRRDSQIACRAKQIGQDKIRVTVTQLLLGPGLFPHRSSLNEIVPA